MTPSEKFKADPEEIIVPQCSKCKHYLPGTMKCHAFPNGMPNQISSNEFNHVNPYPGDNGIRFEPK